jgi:hypothetical protein
MTRPWPLQGHAYHIEKRRIRETVDLADAHTFVWGEGEYGKLGHQTTDRMNVPYIVGVLQKIPIRMVRRSTSKCGRDTRSRETQSMPCRESCAVRDFLKASP